MDVVFHINILGPLVAKKQFVCGWTLNDTMGCFVGLNPESLATTFWETKSHIHSFPSADPEIMRVSWVSTLDSKHKLFATWPVNSPSNSPESLSINLTTPSAQLTTMHWPSLVKLAHVTASVIIHLMTTWSHFYLILFYSSYYVLPTSHIVCIQFTYTNIISTYFPIKRSC